MTIKYSEYIDSDEWKIKSKEYLLDHPICEICNKHKSEQVHHTSYKRMGDELDKDLKALCERCHNGIHNFPPYIPDDIQRNKALKIMQYFRRYPSIKTLVLNEVSRKYYNYEFMLDRAAKISDETSLFNQNLMEMFYQDGIDRGEDIIEFTYAECVKLNIQAKRNALAKKKASKVNRNKINKDEIVKIVHHTTRFPVKTKNEMSKDEIYENRIKNFVMSFLSNNEYLANAKRFANNEFYDGKMYFNKNGYVTKEQFYKKLKDDGHHVKLFIELGGKIEKITEEI